MLIANNEFDNAIVLEASAMLPDNFALSVAIGTSLTFSTLSTPNGYVSELALYSTN